MIASLTPETYPNEVRIACDSTYHHDLSPSGQTLSELHPDWPAPPPGFRYVYDDDRRPTEDFLLVVDPLQQCGGNLAGMTTYEHSSVYSRITFCPDFLAETFPLGGLGEFKARVQTGNSKLNMFDHMGSLTWVYHSNISLRTNYWLDF